MERNPQANVMQPQLGSIDRHMNDWFKKIKKMQDNQSEVTGHGLLSILLVRNLIREDVIVALLRRGEINNPALFEIKTRSVLLH